jgi:hypothetical protein
MTGRTKELIELWRKKTPFGGDDHFVFFGEGGKQHLLTRRRSIERSVLPWKGRVSRSRGVG